MKILHLSAVKTWGGGENHIENLYRELREIEVKTENFILCVKNSDFHKVLKRKNIPCIVAPLLVKFDLRYVFKIVQLCEKHKIDLIHIHDSTALTLAVMARNIRELPPFIFSKKTSFPIKSRKRTLFKYNHENIQKILCVSNATLKITAKNIADTSKLTTIYHGTSLEKCTQTPFKLREKLNIPEDKLIIGTIANHIRAKNMETWVELVDNLINKKGVKQFHFVQIGNFTKRTPAYLEMIENRGIREHISFLGFIPDASNFIPQFDISLLTSQSEGIPQFIYESFYHKVPVVSTNVGGIPEIIKDGSNAMLSNPFEVEALADKLIALSQDKELQKKFTELSYKKLRKNFSTRIMAEKTLNEYKKVVYGKN